MAYYPKSQIKTDLYTTGGELAYLLDVKGRDKEYKGFYWKTSKGTFFSGRNPNDPTTEALVVYFDENNPRNPFLPPTVLDGYQVDQIAPRKPGEWNIQDPFYNKAGLKVPGDLPMSFFPTPTDQNYDTGEFQRYFLNRIGHPIFIEVDQLTYEQYEAKDSRAEWPLYTPFKISWELTGIRSGTEDSAFEINKRTVERIQRNLNLKGFDKWFKGKFTEFFKFSENENLYTPGGEFLEEIKTPGYPTVQRDYVGFYHIHPDKGPMVGSQHIDGPHNYLIPYPVKDEIKKEQKREQMIRDASRSIQPPAPQPPSSPPSTGYGGY